jgi:hypothetical protein
MKLLTIETLKTYLQFRYIYTYSDNVSHIRSKCNRTKKEKNHTNRATIIEIISSSLKYEQKSKFYLIQIRVKYILTFAYI